ncbi:C40 family peptidase [Streptomyces sp. UH6]|uniref:C40 family peptidase n=1 Tax=Streptomyces sp. UH6 TaxID=2748379 RepID=UPI0015D47330|nr:C40 family peptidase [Streptomyces sp. UH6]NYV74371.1 C40 family peptidase [Streptomyces sp. UH6]
MSQTAHIRSHRKPRRSASKIAMRAGVAGGVLSTLAVAGASGTATAAEPVTQTLELPTLTADLTAEAAISAEATASAAATYELQAERDAAAERAADLAERNLKKAKAEAEAKQEAEEKAAREAAERASRDSARETLTTASASSSASTAVSGSAAAVVAFAKAQVGDAYVSGATGPNAWDCSGLVQAAYKQAGVSLPRVSQDQSVAGTQVSLSNLLPGDILYWGGAGSAYHVAIYVGGGQFVGAQNSGTGVVQASLDYDPPSGAVRVL